MPPFITTTGLPRSRARASASTKASGSDRPSAYTAITRVPSSSTSARMNSARPSAASLPQLAVTRKPRPNSSARACAMTAMPPLWLTIETTPGMRRLLVAQHRRERRGEPVAGVEDAHAIRARTGGSRSCGRRAASSSCFSTPSPPTSAKPPAHATPDGTPAATQSRTTSSDVVRGDCDHREIGRRRAGRAGSGNSAIPRPCRGPALTGHTGPAKPKRAR